MGWSDCGTDNLGRPIGYSHHGQCDHPGCNTPLDRGLAYVCGGTHGGGENGCGGYFCYEHLLLGKGKQLCPACYEKAPDTEE